MKNGTHPLYTLLRDPKPIATNGSTKKHTASFRKIILAGCIIAIASGVSIWQLREYQKSERREQFITWVAKYRPGLGPVNDQDNGTRSNTLASTLTLWSLPGSL